MLLQLSWFFPSGPLHPAAPTPSGISPPLVICINYLATSFPTLYFTSPWLFCNCLFALLNSLTSSPIPHMSLPSSNGFPIYWIKDRRISINTEPRLEIRLRIAHRDRRADSEGMLQWALKCIQLVRPSLRNKDKGKRKHEDPESHQHTLSWAEWVRREQWAQRNYVLTMYRLP